MGEIESSQSLCLCLSDGLQTESPLKALQGVPCLACHEQENERTLFWLDDAFKRTLCTAHTVHQMCLFPEILSLVNTQWPSAAWKESDLCLLSCRLDVRMLRIRPFIIRPVHHLALWMVFIMACFGKTIAKALYIFISLFGAETMYISKKIMRSYVWFASLGTQINHIIVNIIAEWKDRQWRTPCWRCSHCLEIKTVRRVHFHLSARVYFRTSIDLISTQDSRHTQ